MTEEIEDFSSYFKNYDIAYVMTQWKQGGKDFSMIFLPLEPHNKPQYGIQKTVNNISRLDFKIQKVEDKLIFIDLITTQFWVLDLSELYQSKIHLVGENSKATFVREELVNLGFSL